MLAWAPLLPTTPTEWLGWIPPTSAWAGFRSGPMFLATRLLAVLPLHWPGSLHWTSNGLSKPSSRCDSFVTHSAPHCLDSTLDRSQTRRRQQGQLTLSQLDPASHCRLRIAYEALVLILRTILCCEVCEYQHVRRLIVQKHSASSQECTRSAC